MSTRKSRQKKRLLEKKKAEQDINDSKEKRGGRTKEVIPDKTKELLKKAIHNLKP